jgi:hypothetical protein
VRSGEAETSGDVMGESREGQWFKLGVWRGVGVASPTPGPTS